MIEAHVSIKEVAEFSLSLESFANDYYTNKIKNKLEYEVVSIETKEDKIIITTKKSISYKSPRYEYIKALQLSYEESNRLENNIEKKSKEKIEREKQNKEKIERQQKEYSIKRSKEMKRIKRKTVIPDRLIKNKENIVLPDYIKKKKGERK